MNADRTADNFGGVSIGQVRANGEVYSHAGVHIGHVDADGVIRDHGGVRIGKTHVTA